MMITMVRAVPTIMIEMVVIAEVGLVFSVKPVVVVFVVDPVAIMSMPCRISIIGISRISRFVDTNGDVYLRARRTKGQRTCHYGGDNK